MNEWTMTQSAYGLDISDDESKAKDRLDRGKENVDPNEISVPVTRSMAAAAANVKPASRISRRDKDDMSDEEPRTPLGDLNPTEFYAEGLDATSVVLVHDETVEAEVVAREPEVQEAESISTPQFNFSSTSPLTTKAIEALDTPSIDQILGAPTIQWDSVVDSSATTAADLDITIDSTCQDVEIWESESAKDENENEKVDLDIVAVSSQAQTQIDDGNAFALQEL